jgi:flagellar biosynthetic protein FliP
MIRVLLLMAALLAAPAVEAPPLATPTGAPAADNALVGGGAVAAPLATPGAPLAAPTAANAIASGITNGIANGIANDNGRLTVAIDAAGPKGASAAVTLLLLITALAVAPAFLMMMTSFTRIIIVLGFVRRALGTQTLPPNQVMVGLALFLTLFTMKPTLTRLDSEALRPWLRDEISQAIAIDRAKGVVHDFMIRHTRKSDLALFVRLSGDARPATAQDVSFLALVPAFITSELKTAFQMGFVIFLPFLVIDLVISAVLMALGMMMLPPIVVSLPFKILLFVLVDGWALLVQGLAASYR